MMQEELLTYKTLNPEKLTPMMHQYIGEKKKWSDAILMFRLGDFYEMFFDDAITASKVLELVLTARDCGQEKKAPMCGVPHHAASSYMQKLVGAGYKVAICDQMEDPALAKGIVKRSVTRILTPGTITEISGLDEKKNNYILCVFRMGMQYGIAVTDLTTGTFLTTQFVDGNTVAKLTNQIARFSPSEIICNEDFAKDPYRKDILCDFTSLLTIRPDRDFSSKKVSEYKAETRKKTSKRDPWKAEDVQSFLYRSASSALLCYLEDTQQGHIPHLHDIEIYDPEQTMDLDAATRKNLELVETIRTKNRKGSLLWAIDRTKTPMGSRLLRKWLEQPLLVLSDIQLRQDAVSEAKERFLQRQELIEAISGLHDLERLTSRIALRSVHARDLLALRESLGKLPSICSLADAFSAGLFSHILPDLDPMEEMHGMLLASIAEEPPLSVKEGEIIKPGFHEEVDRLRSASQNGKSLILELEAKEKEKTGIKTMKTGYNRVFGYYLEVSKGSQSLVPDYYIRKQTLANAERFITHELKELEDTILGAQQRLVRLEYDMFCEIRDKISAESEKLLRLSAVIAQLDVILALGELADREKFVRPKLDDSRELQIQGGRHPVIEKMLPPGSFVPNDIFLDDRNKRVMVLTGPNMAGKSTYMRQTALIVLLAQMGSFVPADMAKIGIVDRIFTRIGASDDLTMGQSTFMVEMNEVSTILREATGKSLLLLDEVGRGTSTYDGLSIAWAILEFICAPNIIFARTLFATHYHELNSLEGNVPGIFNAHVEVDEKDGDIVFLHEIAEGGTDDSYGIEVAKLAGVPQGVVERAKKILYRLEKSRGKQHFLFSESDEDIGEAPVMEGQVDFFHDSPVFSQMEDPIRTDLKDMDISKMTPLEAMNILYKLIEKAKCEQE